MSLPLFLSITSFQSRYEPLREANDFVDVSGRENPPDPLWVELRERRIHQVPAFHPAPLENERPQSLQEADLKG